MCQSSLVVGLIPAACLHEHRHIGVVGVVLQRRHCDAVAKLTNLNTYIWGGREGHILKLIYKQCFCCGPYPDFFWCFSRNRSFLLPQVGYRVRQRDCGCCSWCPALERNISNFMSGPLVLHANSLLLIGSKQFRTVALGELYLGRVDWCKAPTAADNLLRMNTLILQWTIKNKPEETAKACLLFGEPVKPSPRESTHRAWGCKAKESGKITCL